MNHSTPKTDAAVNSGGFQLLNVAKCSRKLEIENMEMRVMLAVCHAGVYLYADDGELQDTREEPCIDWKRDSIEEIHNKLVLRAVNRPEYKEFMKQFKN